MLSERFISNRCNETGAGMNVRPEDSLVIVLVPFFILIP